MASAMASTSFGVRLKALRLQRKWSRRELAERAGLSQRAIQQWEDGMREPSWSSVLALAKALGVPCTAFELDGASGDEEE